MKKIISLLLIPLIFVILSCSKKTISPEVTARELSFHQNSLSLHEALLIQKEAKKQALENYLLSIPLSEKICQMFVENANGNTSFVPVETMSTVEKGNDSPLIPGGFLFFAYNLADSPKQVMKFTDSIINYCIEHNKIPPFLSVDQEGGLVNRLKKLTGTFPSAKNIAQTLSVDEVNNLYYLQALQMKSLNLNLNFAPVVEVLNSENANFLQDRSYGSYEEVMKYASPFISEFEGVKEGTVLKHFPGNSSTDPHTGLPEITMSKEELMTSIKTFENLIKLNPSGVLMSHARTSAIDSKTPSCLSSVWVSDLLRNTLNYNGVIFSDDIFMGALAANNYPPEKAVVMAVEAGIDCIMVSEKRISKPVSILLEKAQKEPAFAKKIEESCERMIKLKLNIGILEYMQNGDGSYSIVPSVPSSFEDRLASFNKNRSLNMQIFNQE